MKFEHEDGRRGQAVALRFGSSLTGVGLGGALLYLLGQDKGFTEWVSMLFFIGVVLLAVGLRARRKNRP